MKRKVNKRFALWLALVSLLVSSFAMTPALADHAGEEFTGNLDCGDFGLFDFDFKIDPVPEGVTPHNGPDGLVVTINVYEEADGWYFDWSANRDVAAVIAKGSNGGYFYSYDPAVSGDTGLHAIIAGGSGKWAALSHMNFCYNEEPPELEGCTPGFWQGGDGAPLWNEENDPDFPIAGANPYAHTTMFTSFFAKPNIGTVDGLTMFQLANTGGGSDPVRRAARSMVAAYLNASAGANYEFTTTELMDMWDAAVLANTTAAFSALHLQLDAANNAEGGCPFDSNP